MKRKAQFKFEIWGRCTIFRTIYVLIVLMPLLSLYIFMNDGILLRYIPLISHNATVRFFKALITSKNDQSLLLSVEAIRHIHQQDSCSIEAFGGFEGAEQAYISGTLFRDIKQTCSCYTHYQTLDKLVSNKREREMSALHPSLGRGRVVWCVGPCPDYIRNWCKNETHRDYCQKYVVLFELSDEASAQPIDHYSYFAAVYRNYLRYTSGDHLSYLTQNIRNLPRTKDTLRIHRMLNWSLAINIIRDEWKAAAVNIDDFSTLPSSNVTAQINNRIIKRLLHNNEGITYHTWPDLDGEVRKHTKKNVPVFWFPLGYTNIYLDNTVQFSIAPLSKQQKLWTWAGSMKLNERPDMTKAFETKVALTEHTKQLGMLTITSAFVQDVKYMDYTSQLLESQFVPLPRGRLPPELLDDWQSIMLLRHRIVMNTMTKHIGSVVCAANTPHGYRYQDMQKRS